MESKSDGHRGKKTLGFIHTEKNEIQCSEY